MPAKSEQQRFKRDGKITLNHTIQRQLHLELSHVAFQLFPMCIDARVDIGYDMYFFHQYVMERVSK